MASLPNSLQTYMDASKHSWPMSVLCFDSAYHSMPGPPVLDYSLQLINENLIGFVYIYIFGGGGGNDRIKIQNFMVRTVVHAYMF